MENKIEITKVFDDDFVKSLIKISGDSNPIHSDEAYAARSYFKKRIVPAASVFCLISQGLTKMFGPGNLWTSQSMIMKKPIFINEQVKLEMEILSNNKKIFNVRTTCFNAKNEIVMDGVAQSVPVYWKD